MSRQNAVARNMCTCTRHHAHATCVWVGDLFKAKCSRNMCCCTQHMPCSRQHFLEKNCCTQKCCCTKHVQVFKATYARNMCWGWRIYQSRICTQYVLLYATFERVQSKMCKQHVLLHETCARTQRSLLAPHTSGPRDVLRCGALSLLQKTPCYRGGWRNCCYA